jgi:hypothetical protein
MSELDDMTAVVSRHLALWSVKDYDLRLREINDVYGEEIEVIEPTGLPLGPGRLGLHEHIGLLQNLLGDFTFEVDGDIETHHGWATYAWIQRPPYNGRTVTGREVIHVVDGRIVFLFMVIENLELSEPPDGVSSYA